MNQINNEQLAHTNKMSKMEKKNQREIERKKKKNLNKLISEDCQIPGLGSSPGEENGNPP